MKKPHRKTLCRFSALCLVASLATHAEAQQTIPAQKAAQTLEGGWRVERPAPGVRVIRDDKGYWNGTFGTDNSTTHQAYDNYWIEKTLMVPAEALVGVKEVRLRVLMGILDYSQGDDPKKVSNGLDETFDLVVNGQSKTYATSDNFPSQARLSAPSLRHKWHDFLIPIEQIKAGANTFLIRKSAGTKGDDYVYIAIDNSIALGHSRMSDDGGKNWSTYPINRVSARGEYLMRLVLLDGENQKTSATWTPAKTVDSRKLFGFVGIENAAGKELKNLVVNNAAKLAGEARLRMEIDTTKIDRSSPLHIRANFSVSDVYGAPPRVVLRDAQNNVLSDTAGSWGEYLHIKLPPWSVQPALIEFYGGGNPASSLLKEVQINYSADPVPLDDISNIDLAPRIAAPKFKVEKRTPAARLTSNGFVLENGVMQMTFDSKPHLQLLSVRHELLGKNILADPKNAKLFLVEIGDKKFGAADWQVSDIKVTPDNKGVLAQLTLPQYSLAATLTLAVDESDCRMKLNIVNKGNTEQSWKTAFPHLGGLQLSADESDDHYLFPYAGSVISSVPTNLRSSYGSNSAWWQMMDLYSPTGGAGLSMRIDDATGLYKSPALRKGITASAGTAKIDALYPHLMDEALVWKDSLGGAPGTAMTFEYLSRTRPPGASFAPPDGVLRFHTGDWHEAMKEYSRWAHTAWKWRPFSAKLNDVWDVKSPGWGNNRLWRDGKYDDYKSNYIYSSADMWELYGWWNWSDKAPWGLPIKDMAKLGDPDNPYLGGHTIANPATGKTQWQQNVGDYDGYHPEWGGLPAFRKYVKDIRDRGTIPMLYTAPNMADADTETGKKYGKKYGIVNPRWKEAPDSQTFVSKSVPENYVGTFYAWAMCPDNDFYPDYVANQFSRVIRETDADGIRMDVWGWRGQACTNPLHKHIFAEPGHNAYMQGTAAATEKIRAAIDKVKPGVILTTEFPGADYMMHSLDGGLVYETTGYTLAYPLLRPVPINVMRFYFPEFRTFDLDSYPINEVNCELRFWNAVGSFDVKHLPPYHRLLQENGDVFNAPGAMPLVPTLQSRIYANRFTKGDKTIWTLLNGGRFTNQAPVLRIPADANFHTFDLLNGQELKFSDGGITIKVRPQKAAVIARLPRRLTATKTATGARRIVVKNAKPGARLVLCDVEGAVISQTKVTGGQAVIALPGNSKAIPNFVKLFEGKYLQDAAEWPR